MLTSPPSFGRAPLRVALVHDWLVTQRGGEQVLLALCALFPHAHIFTLVHRPGAVAAGIEAHAIYTSFIQRLTGPRGRFRHLLPLFFTAAQSLDVSGYDVVISSSHCVAHNVRAAPGAVHIAYVHSPMRYLYDQMPHYLPRFVPPSAHRWVLPLVRAATAPLRRADRRAALRPTVVVANSAYVAARIQRVWHREAQVVHPPVDTAAFAMPGPAGPQARRGLLWVGALVPYKRVDVCVATSNLTGVPLTVVGRGAALEPLRRMAGPQVRFLGDVPHRQLLDLYASHEALMYPGEEDFGIVPVEAMAAGCPVLGLNAGGLIETVCTQGPGATGVLVDAPDAQHFAAGLVALRAMGQRGLLRACVLRAHAEQFSQKAFAQRMAQLVRGLVARAPVGAPV